MPKDRSQFDAALRTLLQSGPRVAFESLGIGELVELLPNEYGNARQLRLDFVARTIDGRIVHIEIEVPNTVHMPDRMLEYYLTLWRKFEVPPKQYVLFVGPGRLRMRRAIRHPDLKFQYNLIDIRTLDAKRLLESPHMADNLLSLLCAGKEVNRVLKRLVRKIERQKEQVGPLLSILLILCQLRGLKTREALEALEMPDVLDLKEFPALRKSVDKLLKEGEAAGLVKGLEQGREQGLEQGLERGFEQGRLRALDEARKRLRRQLEHRFGKLPVRVLKQLDKANSKTLDSLSIRLLDVESLKQLFP